MADQLPEYAYTTVATMLDRLVRKGLVSRMRQGRILLFRAVGSRADHAAGVMVETLTTNGDPEAVLRCFVSNL